MPNIRALLLASTVLTAVAITPAAPLAAQSGTASDSARADSVASAQALGAVRVTVTRDAARSPFELPFAISTAPLASRPAQRRIGVGDLLFGVPGAQVQDRANPSQDPRVTVRGFGARSAFGVRGVRMVRDGVPLSLPDGQTPLDWLDLETVDRVDVVRGTAAALYGNAAGGVVELRSVAPAATPAAAQLRLWDGGGLQRANVLASGTVAPALGALATPQWLASFTRTRGDGPRTWSRFDASSAFLRLRAVVKGTQLEVQGTHYDAPRAENPGALTAAELARDPRLPDSLNITRRSRKAVTQSQVALIAERAVGAGVIRGSLFTGARTLDNPLPFAIVAVDRRVVGGGVHGAWRTTVLPWPLRLSTGLDAQRQGDDRFNYENCADVAPTVPVSARCPVAGRERGAVRLDQREELSGVGVYARAEVEAPHGVFLSAALRRDQVAFRVRDHFIATGNPDDSGERTLRATSPLAGLTWRLRPTWSWYANVATAFETPTITELTNQESGAAGLNATLEPQRTRTTELGTQALVAGRVRVDAALFRATVLDELVGFDVPGQAGRRAFRNAGRTSRRGVEAGLRAEWTHLSAGASYTWARYRFDQYSVGTTSFAGKPIPGIPAEALQAFATARGGPLWSTLEVSAASRVSANDAATVFASGWAAWTWRTGFAAQSLRGARLGGLRAEPVLSIENLFDRRYAPSVVINATRGRYFEPGLPRRVSLVMKLSYE
ncbi:MAG: TonB-dependent receptor [Gemmatimonadetes bacterium]|nr:TonB-dependent receptor [Gemmatimonadota bacterium]